MGEKRKYTNVFVEKHGSKVIATMKAKFKNAVTYEDARAEGVKEASEKWYLEYLGVLNVDVTNAQLKKLLK